MGIGSKSSKTNFSNDILHIELSGPSGDHLSIIDVPGLFRNTSGKSTKTDIALIRKMVTNYMSDARSVILAIVPANADFATQEITQMAKDFDPQAVRTLGIFTKPDLVDEGAEGPIIKKIQGTETADLGWHVVRNPGQKALGDPSKDRYALEKDFFETRTPWKDLYTGRVGMTELRNRLRKILNAHYKRELPSKCHAAPSIVSQLIGLSEVKKELDTLLATKSKRLSALGRSRENTLQQSQYLMNVAVDFQTALGDCA
ncbi:MAG: dynamin family protein, partial [Janthinobacterium lividum]